jgi:hypothetical protein
VDLFLSFNRQGRRAVLWGGLWWLAAVAPVWAHVDLVMADQPKFDVLVYADGDRLKGHLKERSETGLVFLSDRFGLLHVPVTAAKVILANGEEDSVMEARARTEEAEGPFNVWSLFSVRALTSEVRNFFGPWHGRFNFSTQLVRDTTERTNYMAEAHLQRKWKQDAVQLNGRFDFSDTDHVTTTDVYKLDASWRHDFKGRLFSIYGPSMEWNRAFAIAGVPADYVLLQQEVGAGVNVFTSPQRNLRVGLAENVFDLWQVSPPASHTSKTAESAFLEADWQLPWQMKLTERGVWYYSINTGKDGWENKLELDKKLSETFTVGIRHEVRYNNPGVRVQDYTLLKLLVGIDF